jgi:hypothetical protein
MDRFSHEPQVIPEEEARAILRAAIAAKIGENWDAPNSGWTVVSSHAYMARLNKGRANVDFHVNYFTGEVTTEVKEIDSGQDVGRWVAWVLALIFTVLVVVLARGLGLI